MSERWMVAVVVQTIVEIGTQNTTNGNWHVSYDEVEDVCCFATKEWLSEHHCEILDELDARAEILSDTWTDFDDEGNADGFDCNFAGAYCPYWQE